MTYEVIATRIFLKDFQKLGRTLQAQVRKKVEEIAEDPTRHKRLHHALKGSSRARVGKLRIVFSYNARTVFLERVVTRHNY